MAKKKKIKEKAIEEALWESANKLRGSVEPSGLPYRECQTERYFHQDRQGFGKGGAEQSDIEGCAPQQLLCRSFARPYQTGSTWAMKRPITMSPNTATLPHLMKSNRKAGASYPANTSSSTIVTNRLTSTIMKRMPFKDLPFSLCGYFAAIIDGNLVHLLISL